MRMVNLLVVLALALFGCESAAEPEEPLGDPVEVERSYINFHAYWSDGIPAIVNVSLYENFGDRLERGGTNPNGDYFSSRTYPVDEVYEIFIYHIPTGQCLTTTRVSFRGSTPWPVASGREIQRQLNVGPSDPMNDLEGCRP